MGAEAAALPAAKLAPAVRVAIDVPFTVPSAAYPSPPSLLCSCTHTRSQWQTERLATDRGFAAALPGRTIPFSAMWDGTRAAFMPDSLDDEEGFQVLYGDPAQPAPGGLEEENRGRVSDASAFEGLCAPTRLAMSCLLGNGGGRRRQRLAALATR